MITHIYYYAIDFTEKKIEKIRDIPDFYIWLIPGFHPFLDPSHDLCPDLESMSGLLHEREEVILQEYLEFCIFEDLDCRCARFISDECDLSEERAYSDDRYLFSSLEDSDLSTIDIVGTTVRYISDGEDTFSFFSILCLAHEEKIGDLLFRESIENIEFFDICRHSRELICLYHTKES